MKNIEQLDRMLHKKFKDARERPSKRRMILKTATQLLLSRPDHDYAITKLFPTLLSELRDSKSLEVFEDFITDARKCLKENRSKCVDQAQVTYLIALDNLVIQLKKFAKDDVSLRKPIVLIAEANFDISPEAQKASKTHVPINLNNPTDSAKAALKEWEKEAK